MLAENIRHELFISASHEYSPLQPRNTRKGSERKTLLARMQGKASRGLSAHILKKLQNHPERKAAVRSLRRVCDDERIYLSEYLFGFFKKMDFSTLIKIFETIFHCRKSISYLKW